MSGAYETQSLTAPRAGMIVVNDPYPMAHADHEVAGREAWRMSVVDRWPQSHIGDPQVYKGSPFSPLPLHHSLFLPTTTTTTLILSHALRYVLYSPHPPSSVQVHLIHAVRHFPH